MPQGELKLKGELKESHDLGTVGLLQMDNDNSLYLLDV